MKKSILILAWIILLLLNLSCGGGGSSSGGGSANSLSNMNGSWVWDDGKDAGNISFNNGTVTSFSSNEVQPLYGYVGNLSLSGGQLRLYLQYVGWLLGYGVRVTVNGTGTTSGNNASFAIIKDVDLNSGSGSKAMTMTFIKR